MLSYSFRMEPSTIMSEICSKNDIMQEKLIIQKFNHSIKYPRNLEYEGI